MEDNNNTASQQENNAGNGGNSTDNAPKNDGNNGIDYDKIQSMINKGVQQKENAILKSYFEQQGMSEDEIKSAVTDWKNKKQTAADQQSNALLQLQEQLKASQSALSTEKLNNKAFNAALDMGLERKVIPYALKMANFEGAFDEKGDIKEDVIQKALQQVVTDVPALKSSENENKGIKIGLGGDDNAESSEAENKLRRAFGLGAKSK